MNKKPEAKIEARYSDGEMSLDQIGETLLEEGCSPREVRERLSDYAKYPIPVNYFGYEG